MSRRRAASVTASDRFGLDPVAKLLAIRELSSPATSFSGSFRDYPVWKKLMLSKLEGIGLSALQQIDILLANTSNCANELVRTYSAIGIGNPERALQSIWSELDNRYGNSASVAKDVCDKLYSYHINSSSLGQSLRGLSDLCHMALSLIPSVPDLAYLDTSLGMAALREKLPPHIANRWRQRGVKYERENSVSHPPFAEFCNFLREISQELNAPGYDAAQFSVSRSGQARMRPVHSRPSAVMTSSVARGRGTRTSGGQATNQSSVASSSSQIGCTLHPGASHSTVDCRVFVSMSVRDRKSSVFRSRRCFRCFDLHMISACPITSSCATCGSTDHHSLLHPDSAVSTVANQDPSAQVARSSAVATASSLLTTSCSSVSCGKTLPVVVTCRSSRQSVTCLGIIDDQSTTSFISSDLVKRLKCRDLPVVDYHLTTLDQLSVRKRGFQVSDLTIRGIGSDKSFQLPPLLSTDVIPDTSLDFASKELVSSIPAVRSFADMFPPAQSLSVDVLIGRDASVLMWAKPHTEIPPFVIETHLGFALVGSVPQQSISGRSLSQGAATARVYCCQVEHYSAMVEDAKVGSCQSDIFSTTETDENVGPSQDDRLFQSIVDRSCVSETGHIEVPLPRRPGSLLPHNREAVLRRMRGSVTALRRSPQKLADCVAFIDQALSLDHIEPVSSQDNSDECYYLPIFAVTHPKKGKTRLVFDSAAQFEGVSLNSILLPGPDQANRLTSVLLRFREGAIGVCADIQSMFHCFRVTKQDRDLLRFFWFENNDPACPLSEYRAKVHVFGNCSSPAVATHGLRLTASLGSGPDEEIRRFVMNDFYVDDGLLSAHTPDEAVRIIRSTRELLLRHHIRLHKLVSNSQDVLSEFPESEIADSALVASNDVDQRALGLIWRTTSDTLSVVDPLVDRPASKRGVVALANCAFDPLGFACPIVLSCRLLLRKTLAYRPSLSWDDTLPISFQPEFRHCCEELAHISTVEVPRSFFSPTASASSGVTLHAFADASQEAIGFVVYVRTQNALETPVVQLAIAGSKVAPKSASTIPRLELCAAVAASRAARLVASSLKHTPVGQSFYTDSAVVLGYISNTTRRFSNYVCNRVRVILTNSKPSEWHFVSTSDNPADLATRPQTCRSLSRSHWLTGPLFLSRPSVVTPELIPVVGDDDLPESKPIINCSLRASTEVSPLERLFHLRSWSCAVGTLVCILLFVQLLIVSSGRSFAAPSKAFLRNRAINILVSLSQRGITQLSSLRQALRRLSPFEQDNVLRAAGRLGQAPVEFGFRHPAIINGRHPISSLLIAHFHAAVGHQGRVVTTSALRDAGFLLLGASRLVRSFVDKCVTCRRLRALPVQQRMADLPLDRIESRPPFENVGMDCFGPYSIRVSASPSTRQSSPLRKVWVLLLCCLYSRAIHLEILFAMDTATFVNALRRFLSIRGACRRIRCDNGTNFVGAANILAVEQYTVSSALGRIGIDFAFNPPFASNFGGVFETKIRSVRRIFDQTLALCPTRSPSLDDFLTLLQEACAIVNSTPYSGSTVCDTEPYPLCPSALLQSKRLPAAVPVLEPDESDISAYGPRRWRRIQYLAEQFWLRWRRDYLASLIDRKKWLKSRRNFQVGDVVVIKDKDCARFDWPLGRVLSTNCGVDGLVRRVRLKIASGREIDRAAASLVLLTPVELSNSTQT